MTRFAPLWQQAGTYPAQLDRNLLAALWPTGGVLAGAVTAVNNTMTLSIAPGTAAVPLAGGQGVALCRWDAAEIVTVTASPPSGQSRIDVVVCQVRDNALDAGPNNDFIFSVVAGTAAASNPAVPATPANAFAVYSVTVPGAAANLNTATLADLRGFNLPVSGMAAGRIFVNVVGFPMFVGFSLYGATGVSFVSNGVVANGGLVVPRTGIYQLTCVVAFSPPTGGGIVYPAIYVNNAQVMQGPPAAGLASQGAAGMSDVWPLKAGDRLALGAYLSGGSATLAAGPNLSYLAAAQIS